MTDSNNIDRVKKLAKQLEKLKKIQVLGSEGEPGYWKLAFTLTEIEGSVANFLNELLPKLLKEQSEEELDNTLLEIGEEFRHIIYHLKDSDYYNYLFDYKA